MDTLTFQKATALSSSTASKWCPVVSASMALYAIDSPARVAAFLAQVGHESGSFVFTKELWGPTPAQSKYEGRLDLGNTQPGDGSKYRGRGLIQITGRANYKAVSDSLGIDFVLSPELLELPSGAAQSAAWFWNSHNLNQYADSGDFQTLTKRINGGLNGLDDRLKRWETAKIALGV
ncbi:chitinase [Burkholderia sp. PAMC 28687]|uniref:glycoside hydrolase family 19 protein n=1 Tax=Burkholderia sp. PAMC 28687 TaxID=1795874 RepID=UPI0007822B4A|nr:glycoside hydrolase family 19 protein [Burkholderia sp. PAMC 28687]AMM17522.1 chitinase [Burkholderia sp. PAMC 28687]